MALSEETKKKISEKMIGKNKGVSKNIFWITNGLDNTKIKIGEEIPNGWKKGRTFSEESRNKMANARIGKKQSNEIKIKQSETQKGENNKYFGKIWVTHPITNENKRINLNELNVYIGNGWVKGQRQKQKAPKMSAF